MRGIIKSSEPVEQSNTQLKDCTILEKSLTQCTEHYYGWCYLVMFFSDPRMSPPPPWLRPRRGGWVPTWAWSIGSWLPPGCKWPYSASARLEAPAGQLAPHRSAQGSSAHLRLSTQTGGSDRETSSWRICKGEKYIHRKIRTFITIRLLHFNCCM